MNEIVNKFLLTGDKFVPELYQKQPGFTYSACGPLTKHCDRVEKFNKTGDLNYIYQNQLGKTCFDHDAAYANSKDLAKGTLLGKKKIEL